MLNIWRKAYETYHLNGEDHRLRWFIFLVIGVTISMFVENLRKDAFPLMAATISVLAGFSFSALFSDRFESMIGLEDPENENDRNDIKVLKQLGDNYEHRVRYFITISVISLVILIFSSFSFSIPPHFMALNKLICGKYCITVPKNYFIVWFEFYKMALFILSFVSIIFFSECLYTFYRLAETILSIIDRRRRYISDRKC